MKTHSTPPPSEVAIIIFRVRADCIFNLRQHTWIFKCVADQKKNLSKVTKFKGKMSNGLKRMKNPLYYFLRFLVFKILLILY